MASLTPPKLNRVQVILAPSTTTTTTLQEDAWSHLAFAPDRRLWAIQKSGRVAEMEWNSVTEALLEGTLRDAGTAMPSGYWETGNRRAHNRRAMFAAVEREESTDPVTLTHYSTNDPAGQATTVAADGRHARVPMSVRGWWHRTRVSVPETMDGVTRITVVESPLGPRLKK